MDPLKEAQISIYEELDKMDEEERPPLFMPGGFKLHSGQYSAWKIECDHLSTSEIFCLAEVAASYLPAFRAVEGVPSGGLRLARALEQYADSEGAVLIVDDVLTTGASMEEQRAGRQDVIGLVIFARGECPGWVQAIFNWGLT